VVVFVADFYSVFSFFREEKKLFELLKKNGDEISFAKENYKRKKN
jgi:hypothetical protein